MSNEVSKEVRLSEEVAFLATKLALSTVVEDIAGFMSETLTSIFQMDIEIPSEMVEVNLSPVLYTYLMTSVKMTEAGISAAINAADKRNANLLKK